MMSLSLLAGRTVVSCKLTVMLYVSKPPVPVSGSSAWTVITGEFTGVSCINIILLYVYT